MKPFCQTTAKIFFALICFLFAKETFCLTIPTPCKEALKFDQQLFNERLIVAFSSHINPEAKSLLLEKEKFFASLRERKPYNPTLAYKQLPVEIRRIANSSSSLQKNCFYQRFLNENAQALSCQAKMLLTTDANEFTQLSCQLYPAPEDWLILEAYKLALSPGSKEADNEYSANELVTILRDALIAHSLLDWKVVISEKMSARASVSPASKKIKVNSSASFSKQDAKRLILHEIGVHAIRAENGSKRAIKLFTTGFPGYMTTEEGLAVNNEFLNGIDHGLPLFAMRVLAVHWALNNSFHQTFKLLKAVGASDEIAWRITVRCKRGLTDTSADGAYTKDAAYLEGFFLIRKALKKDKQIIKDLLEPGKIALKDLRFFR